MPTHAATIMRVDAQSLSASGAPAFPAAATITSSHVWHVQGLAIDGDGTLWIAVLNAAGSVPAVNLVRYSSSQLGVSGTRTIDPQAVVTVTGAVSLGSLALDEGGNLWIEDYAGRTLSRLRRSTIVASGSFTVTPDIVVATPHAAAPGIPGMAFDPPAAGLPIAQ